MSEFSAKIIAQLDTSKVPSQIKNIEKSTTITLKKFSLDTSGLPSQIQASLDRHKFKISLDGIKMANVDNQMKNAGNSAGQAFSQSLVNRINSQVSNGGIESSIAKVTAQYEKLGTTGHVKLAQIKTDLESLNNLQANMSSEKDSTTLVTNYERFNDTLSRVKNNLATVSAESKTFVSSLQISTLDNKISTWMDNNSRASRDFGTSIGGLRARLAELNSSGNATVANLKEVESEFNAIKNKAIAAGKVGTDFGSQIKGAFSSILKYVSVSTVIYQSIAALKEMYQNVYSIDTEMTELRKVTNETSQTYSDFLNGAGATAKKIGATISGYIGSTADFARLGYDFVDSQELSKTANIYSVIGDEIDSVDTATKSIISTYSAYKDEITDTIDIVDKFNEVSNHFAISSGGIGDALQRSASSLSAANNTLDQSIALITAANTVVQDPDAVGTAFKTMSARIRGAKTELEEMGEDTDGVAESTAKLQEEVMALSGVDIMSDANTFKSTYDILDELANKWENLSDIQQASLTELLSGKRQANVFSSLMKNFDIAREALDTSTNSEGSAMAEHAKWMKSLEAKTKQFKAAWEELSQTLMDDGFLKMLVETGTDILSTLTNIVDKFGVIPSLITAIAIGLSFKNIGKDKMFSFIISIENMPIVIIVLFRYE